MYRKTSFGTQSAEGSRFVERIFTATTTLELRSRDALAFLTDTLAAHRRGLCGPSLLPTAPVPQLALTACAGEWLQHLHSAGHVSASGGAGPSTSGGLEHGWVRLSFRPSSNGSCLYATPATGDQAGALHPVGPGGHGERWRCIAAPESAR